MSGIVRNARGKVGLHGSTIRSPSMSGVTLWRPEAVPVLVVGGRIPRRLPGILATRLHGCIKVGGIQEPGIKLLGVVCQLFTATPQFLVALLHILVLKYEDKRQPPATN